MLSLGSHLMNLNSTSVVHSLMDSFFEGKKALVKDRLMDSVRVIVDGLFEEMVGQVKEMLLPPKTAHDQEKPIGIGKTTYTPAKSSTSKSPMNISMPPKSKMIFATKSKPGPSTSAAAQPFSGLYKRMAEEDGVGINSNSNSHSNKKKAVTVELQIDGPLDDENDYADVALDEGAGGSGDVELVNNIDIANIHLPNTSKDQHQQRPTPSGKHPCTEPDCEQHQQRPTPSGKHPCTEPNCGKHFQFNTDLKRHLRTHNKAKPFGCTYAGCSSEFGRRESAIRHILNVHLKKQKSGDEEGKQGDHEPPDPATYLSVKEELL
ncbi:PREDICTED: zinc finger protein 143-like [Rhagoletis zephyria]|uniref:zinc finger protein 143-like n=1 Tax=Rhagoletis zephyria TaxID=28612 RepID=UPI0008119A24|nr:PREDICTED: zinc finger protein 143-like [Rhagoletis zephyria]